MEGSKMQTADMTCRPTKLGLVLGLPNPIQSNPIQSILFQALRVTVRVSVRVKIKVRLISSILPYSRTAGLVRRSAFYPWPIFISWIYATQ